MKEKLEKLFEPACMVGVHHNTYSRLVECLHLGRVQGGLTEEGCTDALALLDKLVEDVKATFK